MYKPEQPDRLKELARKWKNGDITESEIKEFDNWYNSFNDNAELNEEDQLAFLKERLYAKIINQRRSGFSTRSWLYAAASIAILICAVSLFFNVNFKSQEVTHVAKYQNDVDAGRNSAILTLANGDKIILDNAENKVLAEQRGMVIRKEKNGMLVFDMKEDQVENAQNLYNTITTPKGGQYQVKLQDGSLVWLNSGSSLGFPVSFNNRGRNVKLSGEAYFEVAKDKKRPFKVNVNGTSEVEVLGTHFNISAYQDEPKVSTTLLEGAVKVHRGKLSQIISPGQQAQICQAKQGIAVNNNVDIEEITAWKNGYFIFNDESLESIMKKVSRWYNVEVVYEDDIEGLKFGGWVSRSKKLSTILSMIESTGKIHFDIEGRRVTVKKY